MKSLKNIYTQYYGDETRWFVGMVESIDDPLKQGRVRVRIFGIHSPDENEVPKRTLPWAQVVAPITHGGTSGTNGTPVGIKPTSLVFGIFLDGKHSQLPLVFGSIPKIDGVAVTPSAALQSGAMGDGLRGGGSWGNLPTTYGDTTTNNGYTAPSSETYSGGSIQEKTFNYLEAGFRNMGQTNSKELAAGFMGNIYAESNYNYLAYNSAGGGNGANGLCQWRGDRWKALVSFADSLGRPLEKNKGGKAVPDTITQLEFILHELNGTEKGAWNRIKQMNTAQKVADQVEAWYERAYTPAQKWSYERRQTVGSVKKRTDEAYKVYNSFAHKVNSASKTGPQ